MWLFTAPPRFPFNKLKNIPRHIEIKKYEEPSAEILKLQELENHLILLDSSRFDSLECIHSRFILKKQKYADRRIYIQNKPQFMLELDRAYKYVEENHDNYYESLEPKPEFGQIEQKIKWELKIARFKLMEKMLADDGLICLFYVLVIGLLVYYDMDTKDQYDYKIGYSL